jgi:hypothetical protein
MGWMGGMLQGWETCPFQQSTHAQVCTDDHRAREREIDREIRNARHRKSREPERERKTAERELLKGLKIEQKRREQEQKSSERAERERELLKGLKIEVERIERERKSRGKAAERELVSLLRLQETHHQGLMRDIKRKTMRIDKLILGWMKKKKGQDERKAERKRQLDEVYIELKEIRERGVQSDDITQQKLYRQRRFHQMSPERMLQFSTLMASNEYRHMMYQPLRGHPLLGFTNNPFNSI